MNVIRQKLFVMIWAVAGMLLTAHIIQAAGSEAISELPVPGMVTMVDIGAKECIPCKLMAPIMEQLEQEYKGRAAIVFVDVWKNPAAGEQFGIKVIPTQIFYDATGREVLRHEGFLDKATIVAELQQLGVR